MYDGRWDCEINEIDVAPVQIQDPKALQDANDLLITR